MMLANTADMVLTAQKNLEGDSELVKKVVS